jgi:hypothetical protein
LFPCRFARLRSSGSVRTPDRQSGGHRPNSGPAPVRHDVSSWAPPARVTSHNHARSARRLVREWAGQGSNSRPRELSKRPPRQRSAPAVDGENGRHARYVQPGAVSVRSHNEEKCSLAGCFEPSTAQTTDCQGQRVGSDNQPETGHRVVSRQATVPDHTGTTQGAHLSTDKTHTTRAVWLS